MNTDQTQAYRIDVKPIEGRATAKRHGAIIAESDHARIMYETRLEPTVYFPREDVRGLLSKPNKRRSFCPFKGTATYWDLEASGEKIEAGAWSYDHALPEGRDVEGMIAFMPGVADTLDTTNPLPEPERVGHIAGSTADWLLRKAWLCENPVELTRHMGHRFVKDGIAVSRLNVTIWSLHPQLAGASFIWTRETDTVSVSNASHENLLSDSYINSPIRFVREGMGGVRQPLNDSATEFDFPIMSELRAKGATDYVAMPLVFSNGQINTLTLASDHPEGFTTANLGLIFECSAVISRYYEVMALRSNALSLLETYLGKRTGARVLEGNIRRGDGENIDAAILFCDMRGSTTLAQQLSRDDYLGVLNTFFDAVIGPVRAHGGEVLKFIGDAVLAIFPAEEGGQDACDVAASAAAAIVQNIEGIDEQVRCAIGLHFGNVTYGNIGSGDRLDFTVIGSAANIAARLSEMCKKLDKDVLISSLIAENSSTPAISLGVHTLRNVAGPVEVYTIKPPGLQKAAS